MSALLHSKTLNAHFWTTLGYSFTCYQQKINLLKVIFMNVSFEND